jgi:hypothetical protein
MDVEGCNERFALGTEAHDLQGFCQVAVLEV